MAVPDAYRFLKSLLKAGHPVGEFDLIIQALVVHRPLDLEALSPAPKGELLSVIGRTPKSVTRAVVAGANQAPLSKKRKKKKELQPNLDPLALEVGRSLLPLVDPRLGARLLMSVPALRELLVKKLGWVCPPIRFRDSLRLGGEEFRVLVRGVEKGRGVISLSHLWATGRAGCLRKVKGLEASEALLGVRGKWIDPELRVYCEKLGCSVHDPISVFIASLMRILKREAHLLFSHQDLQKSLEKLKESNGYLCERMEESPALFTQAKTVFCRLLEEQVPLVDQITIFETLLESQELGLSAYYLTEIVREAIGPMVCRDHVRGDDNLYAMVLSGEVQKLCCEHLKNEAKGTMLLLDPENREALFLGIDETVRNIFEKGYLPVLVTEPCLRRPLRDSLKLRFPDLVVISQNEIQGAHGLVVMAEVSI